jgi:lambda family phage holin
MSWTDKLHESPESTSIVLAVLLTIIRILYGKENWSTKSIRVLLEGSTAGMLAVGANAGIQAMGHDSGEWFIFSGTLIGYVGGSTIREIGLKIVRKKFIGQDNERK